MPKPRGASAIGPTVSTQESRGHEASTTAQVRGADWPKDLSTIRGLFQEYRDWLADHSDHSPELQARVRSGLSLIDQLTAELPGAYGPPRGEVLLWREGSDVVACGALRELEPRLGEIKRIYVREDYRGKEFGRPFVRALIDRAQQLGYAALRADTLPSMRAAIEFYQELGFRPIASYWPHPVAKALFFERSVGPPGA